MLKSRFFRKLFLPYLLLTSVAIGAVGIFGARQLRSSHLNDVERSLDDNAKLIGLILRDRFAHGSSESALGEAVHEMGQTLGRRITIIRADGTVIADTEANPSQMENHRLRPEIVTASTDGKGQSIRPSETVGEDLVYFARRVESPSGEPIFVRLAAHLRDLNRELHRFYLGITIAAVVAIFGAALLCYYFARRHAAPLVELTEFANAFQKDVSLRVVARGDDEVGTLANALDSMADSINRLLTQTRQDKAQLLAMLSSMSEGVIAVDPQQRILLTNEAAGDFLGFETNNAVGRLLWEIVRHEPILRAAGEVLETSNRSNVQVGPVNGRHLDVTLCTISDHAVPTASTPGGLVMVIHDATQLLRYQELRKEFVANVSHELRTPLTAIKGYAETLREGALNDPQRAPQFLATIEKHADQLANLVSDLLELSRLESLPGLPKLSRVSIGAVIEKAVALLRPAAEKKRQSLRTDLSSNLSSIVGNADYLERAVANLLENAIKYTPERGEVVVAARADASRLTVEVTDNGIGIPADELPRIFERFYRVDRSRSREMGGTGLGLSIVKHIVHAHQGTVETASTPGKGSTFRLILPLAADVDASS